MSDEGATATAVAPELKSLGDQIVKLTLLEARSLVDYLKDEYGIEPASGGGMVYAAPTEAGPAAAAEPTEFDVVLTGFGDNKIAVIKVVRAETGLGLKEAKELVEGVPKPLPGKLGISKEDAEKVKKAIEESGGTAEIKPAA